MKNFYNRIRNLLPSENEIKKAISHFSKREYFVFLSFAIILCISTLILLENINQHFMVQVPARGGSITEGIVGTARFINPVLAFSSADQDLVSLIYSGLMRKSINGTLIPDLAQKYDVSKDGLTYTFTLRNNIYFQDGKPVTADDVVFTINEIKDPTIDSPEKGNWDGVSVQKIDDKTVEFILNQPYASFLENTTLGIMPEHIWNNSPIELNNANIEPVGSGPYKIDNISKQSDGSIDYYNLVPFKNFALGEPFISKLTLRFYSDENDQISALEKKDVDQISSITPLNAQVLQEGNYRIESATLPRVFGLFFNQNQNQIFTDKNVIAAMDLVIDKNAIINDVLSGYGVAIDSPIPPDLIGNDQTPTDTSPYQEKIKQAQDILSKDGWQKGTDGFLEKTVVGKNNKKTITHLEFSISTGSAPELAKTAELIKENLESIGMEVDVKTFEIGDLNQLVIRPRKYDALLFGEIINNESDLFAFWHSSQRNDPGLNVAMYTNATVDKLLESAFITTDENLRNQKYIQFENEVKKDMPAVFLYSPNFIYVVSKNLQGFSMNHITTPSDRFLDSYAWYTQTDNVWKMFAK